MGLTHWNYRTVKREEDGEVTFAVYEAYYEDEETKPCAISQNPVYVCGDTLDELRKDLNNYRKALDRPVLNYEDF